MIPSLPSSLSDSSLPENTLGDSLLQTFLGTFCRECTDDDRPRDESFGQVLSWWRRWIALQLPGTTHRAYNRVWLRAALIRVGYRLIQNGQGTRIKGLRLRTARSLSGIPLLPLVTASTDPTLPGDQWLRLRAQASSTHPDDVATWPVRWCYDSVRYAPPDTVLWREFTNECIDRGGNTAGDGRSDDLSAPHLDSPRTRWDVFAATFARWLARKGASHVLRQQHSREWLRTWLEESCGKKIRVRSGVRYVPGYTLRDGVAVPLRDYALPTHLHPGRQIQKVRRGSFAASRYWKEREREARRAAGMPVDDSLYVVSPVPGEDTSGTSGIRRVSSPPPTGALADADGFLAGPTSAARQTVLLPLARQYLSETVCADPVAAVSLHDLKHGFASWLINQSRSDGGSNLALRAALHEWGVRAPEGKKKRLRVVHGYRYRTPDDPLPC